MIYDRGIFILKAQVEVRRPVDADGGAAAAATGAGPAAAAPP